MRFNIPNEMVCQWIAIRLEDLSLRGVLFKFVEYVRENHDL